MTWSLSLPFRLLLVFGLLCACGSGVDAQTVIVDTSVRIIPPRPPVSVPRPTPVVSSYKVRTVEIQAQIKDQAARVQVSQVFQNTSSTTLEAQLIFPLPESAAVSGLTLMVDGKELTGKLLKKDAARKIYEEIVRRRQDPALLEYMGQGMFQTSVFPIPPGAERTVEIRFDQLLPKDSGLVSFLMPIGTLKHSQHAIESLNLTVRLETTDQIKTLYSPTHSLEINRPDDTHATCKLRLSNVYAQDDFRLLYGTTNGLVGMNVLSYRPKADEDGYFVLLASPEMKAADRAPLDRTMMFVVDKSGSMSGKKIEQTRAALKFLIQQLRPGDTFNIVAYDSSVESFRPELQRADEATIKAALSYAEGLFAGGSTNIDGALTTALKQLTDPKRPSYVLFMTDGLPTVGEKNEQSIAANAAQANTSGARLFAFGVGYDVNSRLLDRISHGQHGVSVYVRPNEEIESHVSSLYGKIATPVLTDVAVNFEFDEAPAPGSAPATSRIYPKQVTELFQGEQLVLVGRYKRGGAAKVSLTGVSNGEKQSFVFPANFIEKSADETNGFVEKLWATRRVGEIIDELDLHGQNSELIDELVQLSTRHGIITPYTSFLADENVNLVDASGNRARAERETDKLSQADGRGGFSQRRSKGDFQNAARPQAASGPAPVAGGLSAAPGKDAAKSFEIEDAEGNRQLVTTVRNVGQKSFFRKQDRWQDSTVTAEDEKKIVRITQYSAEYFDLAERQSGAFAKYLTFDEPVIVNLEGKTYQIDPPSESN